MQSDHQRRRNISPEKAISLLSKQGTVISIEDAERVIDLLYLLAEIFVNEIAEDENG